MKWRGPMGGGAASGKVGALVASRARSTQYLRARTTPINPRTTFQTVIRNALKILSQRWSNLLSSGQRSNWTVYAANVPTINLLGDSQILSGVNWYIGNNSVREQAGLPIVDDAPITFDVGNPALADCAFTGSGTNGTFTLGSTTLPVTGDTSSWFILYASRPFAPGRVNPPGGTRIAGIFNATTVTASHAFTLPFSADSTNQMQLTVRLSRGDGRLSSIFTFPKS